MSSLFPELRLLFSPNLRKDSKEFHLRDWLRTLSIGSCLLYWRWEKQGSTWDEVLWGFGFSVTLSDLYTSALVFVSVICNDVRRWRRQSHTKLTDFSGKIHCSVCSAALTGRESPQCKPTPLLFVSTVVWPHKTKSHFSLQRSLEFRLPVCPKQIWNPQNPN